MFLRACTRRAAFPSSFSSRPLSCSTAMPLRAKITQPAFRQYSMGSVAIKEQPGDEPDDVLFDRIYGVRTIELNRPKKLNSLNGSMARKIIPRLQEWSNSQLANVVIVKGAGRALCAGGDVAALAKLNQEGPEGQQQSKDYFALEYKLDHLIATYTKPFISFMDGITMGGGVGLSVHAPFRIATENTVFAMPETTIGFFPDVGASFFLPRMDGQMGTYLALTSEQLRGVDAFYHGIATHYVHSSSLPDLEARLAELTFKDYDSLQRRHQVINATIEEYATSLPESRPAISGPLRMAIDECFGSHRQSIGDIITALNMIKESGNQVLAEWADKTINTMQQRSPTSVLVALKQMRIGEEWGIAEAFQREHAIASKFMEHPDFVEGVTARLVRKQKERPNWQPAAFEDISTPDIEAFFTNTPTLELLNTDSEANYKSYPHAWIGLPREADVLKARINMENNKQTVRHFLNETNNKVGVREKVEEILQRHYAA